MKITISFFIIILTASLYSDAAPPLIIDTISPAKFTAEYVKHLKQKKPAIAPEVLSDLHVRTTIDGKTYNAFLNNHYKEYLSDVSRLKAILSLSIKTSLALFAAGITVDINRIVPVIKQHSFLKDSANIVFDSTLDTDSLNIVFDNYNEQLIVLYGQDVKTHICYFGTADLKKACINRNELREIAVSNLTQLLPQIKTLDDNGMYMVQAGGCYEASLILCRKFWNRLQFPVNGEIIIAVPSKDIVLVAGNKDKPGMKKIRNMAEKLHKESGFPLVKDLFVLDSAGSFKKYSPVTESVKRKTEARIVKKAR